VRRTCRPHTRSRRAPLPTGNSQQGRRRVIQAAGEVCRRYAEAGYDFLCLSDHFVGVYGYPKRTSPNIDTFAERSLVFDRAYTVAPVTPTSFASAFSGLLPTRMFHAWKFVAEDTLAARFSAAGYTSVGIVNSVQLTPQRDFDRGFDHYLWLRMNKDDVFLDQASAWLLDHSQDGPLFAWIHFLVPHAPYVYRDLATHLYDSDYEGPFAATTGGRFEAERPQDIERVRSLYDGNVFFSDMLFGRLMSRLESLGLRETTIVVLTSDHGEEFLEHGGFQHAKLTEETVRIPLLIYHPEVGRGSRTDVLYSNVDLMPTLLALVAHPSDGVYDGRNLLGLEDEPDRVLGVAMTDSNERYVSIREGSRKLILTCVPDPTLQLFDLEADPAELDNLALERSAADAGLASRLEGILGGDPCSVVDDAVRGQALATGLDEESIQALKDLGYL